MVLVWQGEGVVGAGACTSRPCAEECAAHPCQHCPCCSTPATPQLSSLYLWILLLGTEDYSSMAELRGKLRHRRPPTPAFLDLVARMARITTQAEVGC